MYQWLPWLRHPQPQTEIVRQIAEPDECGDKNAKSAKNANVGGWGALAALPALVTIPVVALSPDSPHSCIRQAFPANSQPVPSQLSGSLPTVKSEQEQPPGNTGNAQQENSPHLAAHSRTAL